MSIPSGDGQEAGGGAAGRCCLSPEASSRWHASASRGFERAIGGCLSALWEFVVCQARVDASAAITRRSLCHASRRCHQH
jgi:hypothetical protein